MLYGVGLLKIWRKQKRSKKTDYNRKWERFQIWMSCIFSCKHSWCKTRGEGCMVRFPQAGRTRFWVVFWINFAALAHHSETNLVPASLQVIFF